MSMKTKKENNPYFQNCLFRPVRLSFREAFSRAAQQTELDCAEVTKKDLMRDLCYVIAEVYIIDTNSKINIAEESLDAYLVQEIFRELTFQHLELVANNFKEQTELIKNKRAYLRTALYNSVFELEAHYTNLVAHDFGNGAVKR